MVTSKSVWIGVGAAAAIAMVSCADVLGQTAALEGTSLMFDITPEDLGGLLAKAGYAIRAQDADPWIVDTPTDQVLSVQLLDCRAGRCPAIRIQGSWQLGDREAAIGAARSFEEIEYLANVSVHRSAERTVLLVGRDIWLTSGRTSHNLLSQVEQIDGSTAAVTELLRRKDPGISEYWRDLRETEDE